MFAKMKTGTKILGGFGFAIVIAVTVGAVGYRGISKLGGHVEEMGANRLPSVQSLLEIKVGVNAIKSTQRTLLDLTLAPEIRKHQHDSFAKAKESYEAAWKIYEPLPQTTEEAALWKQFVPAWEEWNKENNEFFRLDRQFEAIIEGGSKQAQAGKSYVDALREAMALTQNIDQAFAPPSAYLEEHPHPRQRCREVCRVRGGLR